jgi:hypothetical protein
MTLSKINMENISLWCVLVIPAMGRPQVGESQSEASPGVGRVGGRGGRAHA